MSEAHYLLNRRAAIKITVKEILDGVYIQEKDQEPNYILLKNNQKIYRLNIIAIVIHKEKVGSITTFLVDDSTGKIILRCFEENKKIDDINLGDSIIIIGKARLFNQEKYISPEIVKKIDNLWLKIRFFEQKNEKMRKFEQNGESLDEVDKGFKVVKEDLNENNLFPLQKITKIIKELDKGEGVLIEEVIEKVSLEGTEELIERMLQRGDIFHNQPGKIKVL